jgi:hypothetical protein
LVGPGQEARATFAPTFESILLLISVTQLRHGKTAAVKDHFVSTGDFCMAIS